MKHKQCVIQINDINIGEFIYKTRKEKGYKQVEVVNLLNIMGCKISDCTYNKIEKGYQNPTVSFILTLCQIFNCDVNTLFGLDIYKT